MPTKQAVEWLFRLSNKLEEVAIQTEAHGKDASHTRRAYIRLGELAIHGERVLKGERPW